MNGRSIAQLPRRHCTRSMPRRRQKQNHPFFFFDDPHRTTFSSSISFATLQGTHRTMTTLGCVKNAAAAATTTTTRQGSFQHHYPREYAQKPFPSGRLERLCSRMPFRSSSFSSSCPCRCDSIRGGSSSQRSRGSSALFFSSSSSSAQTSLLSPSKNPWEERVSARDMAELEDRIGTAVGTFARDPILNHVPLAQWQWLHKRIAVAVAKDDDDATATATATATDMDKHGGDATVAKPPRTTTRITLQLLLRLPSLLHPALDELKQSVQLEATIQVQQWLGEKQLDQWFSTAALDASLSKSSTISSTENKTMTVQVNVEALAHGRPVPMMARWVDDHDEVLKNLGPGLASVAHFVAVYSCKGGVGKSTVAVNLAYELAAMGGRIGLLDLDVYGPSLPILVQPSDTTIRRSPLGSGMVYPIEHAGVKLLSLGFVNKHSGVPGSGPENGAAVMKGPMVVKVVSQLLKGTDWGNLDVLVLDLPPGTGDVQLAVLQQLQLSGAVAVTTPSKLSISDTVKGVELFTSLGVPTLAVVENMSYFEDEDGKRHFPFGKSLQANGLFDKSMKAEVVHLPISISTSDANDCGIPLTVQRPETAVLELSAFRKLAAIVSKELLLLQYGPSTDDEELAVFEASPFEFSIATVSLTLDKIKGREMLVVRLIAESTAIQLSVSPEQLRSRNPKNGDLLPDSPYADMGLEEVDRSNEDVAMVTLTKTTRKRSPSIIPIKVERRGRYGFAIEWGDGATIIYSMRSIAIAAGGKLNQK